jgi:fluoride ion exporter CrcB/FEX
MLKALWIFIGGGSGTLARWGLSGFLARHCDKKFPVGALVANITGSFVASTKGN